MLWMNKLWGEKVSTSRVVGSPKVSEENIYMRGTLDGHDLTRETEHDTQKSY